jgi:hypothetical protein
VRSLIFRLAIIVVTALTVVGCAYAQKSHNSKTHSSAKLSKTHPKGVNAAQRALNSLGPQPDHCKPASRYDYIATVVCNVRFADNMSTQLNADCRPFSTSLCGRDVGKEYDEMEHAKADLKKVGVPTFLKSANGSIASALNRELLAAKAAKKAIAANSGLAFASAAIKHYHAGLKLDAAWQLEWQAVQRLR